MQYSESLMQVEARDCSLYETLLQTPLSASTTARCADQTRPQTTPAQVGRKIIRQLAKIFTDM